MTNPLHSLLFAPFACVLLLATQILRVGGLLVGSLLFGSLSVGVLGVGGLGAQEVPGLRASLTAPMIVGAVAPAKLRLVLQIDQDTNVPLRLLNGLDLTVRVDGEPRDPVVAGGEGSVPLLAGTRVERTIELATADLLFAGANSTARREVRYVSVGWRDMAGVDCTFRVAPDLRDLEVTALDLAKTEVVLITSHGDLRLGFRPDKAPRHVENFVKLALAGFYDGTKFHRVIRDFMIQGGDPNTKDDSRPEAWGIGGPGYTIDAEFNDLRHLRGTLSMARTADPNSAGSGFFIVHKDSPHLDKNYSAFGNLLEGADVLDRIATVKVQPQSSRPIEPVVLHAAVVLPVLKR